MEAAALKLAVHHKAAQRGLAGLPKADHERVEVLRGFGRGVKAKALEQFAKKNNKQYGEPVNIGWNFTKFLVNRAGELVARFEPTADMDEVEKAIKAQL